MRGRVEFRVEGEFPPKKDGASSMWAKDTEVPRLIALREAASRAMAGRQLFRREIELELEVHYPPANGQRMGDLDNFITGVCDGLMAAARGAKGHSCWEDPRYAAIQPASKIVFDDDDAIVTIVAKKVLGAACPWYRVVVEGE